MHSKSFYENAVDAGATQKVQWWVKEAVSNLIPSHTTTVKVCQRTDARMSFGVMHFPKSEKSSDLFSIRTFWFRGEALAQSQQ